MFVSHAYRMWYMCNLIFKKILLDYKKVFRNVMPAKISHHTYHVFHAVLIELMYMHNIDENISYIL